MSRETKHKLKHERKENARGGLFLLAYIIAVVVGMFVLIYFLTH